MIRLTRRQSREVDRIAIEDFGIPSIVLMENAARSAVEAVSDLLVEPQFVGILCGPGNNGGDGLAVARHLTNRGHRVRVLLTAPANAFSGDAGVNMRIAQAMRISMADWPGVSDGQRIFAEPLDQFHVLIDAIFGTGLNRPPSDNALALIEDVNRRVRSEMPVVSLDIPSGLDCDTGAPRGTCIRATRTITFGSQKVGFGVPAAKAFTGDVVVADIGVPAAVIERAAKSLR